MRTFAFLAALPVFVLVALILAKRLGFLAEARWGRRPLRSTQYASEPVLNQVSARTALDLSDLPLDSFPPRF
jgi:hypothetical protein